MLYAWYKRSQWAHTIFHEQEKKNDKKKVEEVVQALFMFTGVKQLMARLKHLWQV